MKNYDIVEMFLSQEFELRDKSIDNYRRYINRFLNDLSNLIKEINEQIQDLYGIEVSSTMVSNITDQILPEIKEWQNRPLDDV